MTDIQIAQAATMLPITEIAERNGIKQESLQPYGRYIAKVDPHAYKDLPEKAKLILVTAITPTPAGEGKTTISISLHDLYWEKAYACLEGTIPGTSFWHEGRRHRRRPRTGASHGEHQPALYRRFACHHYSQQPVGCHD